MPSLRFFLASLLKQLLRLLRPRLRESPSFFNVLWIFVPILVGLAILSNIKHMDQYTLATPYKKGPMQTKVTSTLTSNCDSILKYGRYIEDVNESPSGWQPDGCAMKTYRSIETDDLSSCFKPGDQVIFFGDSTVRQVFWGFANTLHRGSLQKMDSHANSQIVVNGVTITLVWSSYFNESTAGNIRSIARNGLKANEKIQPLKYNLDINYKPKTYLYMTAGSWFAGKEDPTVVAKSYAEKTSAILKEIDNRVDDAFEAVYFAPLLIPHYDSLDRNRQISMTHSQIHSVERIADEYFNYVRINETVKSPLEPTLYTGGVRYRTRKGRTDQISAYYVPVFNELSAENHQGSHDDMGIHFWERGFLIQANILLNHMCNNRIAKATGRPPSGATCCVEYEDYKYGTKHSIFKPSIRQIFDKSILIIPLFALIFAAYSYDINMAMPIFKASVTTVVILGLITAWARISNETQLISKVSIFYSPTEMSGLLQLWAIISILSIFSLTQYFSYGVEKISTKVTQQSRYRLAKPLLLELQGICVSLLLIIQFTGYNIIPHVFDGELLTRVFVSTWSLVELYIFCLEYFDSFKSIQVDGQTPLANATLEQAYTFPLPVFAKSFARVLTLPMLLSVSVTYSVRDSLPGTVPQSYIDPACKLGFWYIFVYFCFPMISFMSKASFVTIKDSFTKDNNLNDLETDSSVIQTLPSIQFGIQTSMLILGSSIPQLLMPVIISFIDIDPFNNFVRALISIYDDYWSMLFAIWAALYSCTQIFISNKNVADAACPTPMIFAAAGFALLGIFDIGKYAFEYYLPESEAGVTHPISFIDRHQEPYNLLLDARGRDYTALAHTVFVIGGTCAYFIIRLGLLRYTRKKIQSRPQMIQYFYIDCWVRMAKFGYELLELYPYVFLALSGTVRLHYLPTGIVHSSLLTRTYGFVSQKFVFPYFKWRLIEKVRKTASILLSLTVLLLLAHGAASVWNNHIMRVSADDFEEVKEEEEKEVDEEKRQNGDMQQDTGIILAINVAENLANGSVLFEQQEEGLVMMTPEEESKEVSQDNSSGKLE
ncbi:uncharacterized protein SAPINGB_P002527 [Magnusiomyces paraingens]|uniref:Cas1p 10 TM acyl transferase domain-containing protein n=1 Tax=Magnusiomyces paraingens TaxID=2606893 RepID=A0A5E8BED6_9ASCO|nr:uncharacterized protein SAPINGB_P002527 [Saprochaete ingens]VVT49953.1 unnamed protein product [Saprochaete ingens]